ncbi:MAG: hypothetical protein HUU06_14010 [Planctomycetaceae bacterium]|nr:hypothetical protein [Planctomycetota bacterium]NUN53882.1 hypothetical protein [Planctomycetaceae bacterium]
MRRAALPLALLLGAAAAVLCWVRLEPPPPPAVECVLTEASRTPTRVVYQVVIHTGFPEDVLSVRPSSEWVRWDPDVSEPEGGGRRILGTVTVGLPGATEGGARPGIRLLVGGRPVRFVEIRP